VVGVAFPLITDVPVTDDVILCGAIAEEDTVIVVGVRSSVSFASLFGCYSAAEGQEAVESGDPLRVSLERRFVDAGVPGSVIEPNGMNKCVHPENNSESGGREEAPDAFLEGFLWPFGKAILVRGIGCSGLNKVAIIGNGLAEFGGSG
jgi:hypothetical protein